MSAPQRPSDAPSGPPQGLGPVVWRGGVNTWECDEMGHMNVRFYLAKAMEGLAGLAARLGMPHAFTPYAEATLIPLEHHIRFLKETHAGAALYMTGGVVALRAEGADLLQVLFDARTHAPAATVISRVAHARPRDAKAFAWPRRTEMAAADLSIALPAFAAPRSVDWQAPPPLARVAEGDLARLAPISLGHVTPQGVDVFGRMRAEEFIGRVSDGIGALLGDVRHVVAHAAAGQHARVGGAVLEYRLIYLDWPGIGEPVEVRSGLTAVADKVQHVGHWLLNPDTGTPLGFSEAVAVTFDLDTRKTIPISDAARQALNGRLIPGHRFGA